MKKVHFVLGVHNHQPIGNFSEVFVTASEKAYKPWIKIMADHPEIKWNLHASGILWDWISENYTSYIQDVDNLIKKGSLELLTGGYYEPILPVIPDADKIGQIKKLSKFIEEEFSFSPKGLWLAERVWEPHLPAVLNKAGVQYTVLDDRHFFEAGMREDELNGYFVTEEQGSILYVFPISQALRYLVPFAPPEEAIAYLKSKAVEGGNSVVVLADDGEKFGLWPGTFDKVYTSGWLNRFIELLNENADWLITCTFSDVLRKFPPRSRLFIPSASYLEMSEWALPVATGIEFSNAHNTPGADSIKRFLKGGFWRNFFIRYPESNDMHKKMLFVSDKLQKALTKEKTSSEKQHIYNAQDHLWAGQCNCAYWHGLFGGIYLPHLRNAVYEQLITAENLLKNGSEGYSHEIVDFRKSGRQEILISGDDQNLYFSPAEGGSLFEWDAVKHGINLINVMTRRQEVYHQKIITPNNGHETGAAGAHIKSIHDMAVCKEGGLEKHLYYDWYRRVCFIDHFFHPATTWENFRTCTYGEQGDFITSEYKWKVNSIDNGICVLLMREGRVWVDNVHHPILVKKKIILRNHPGAEIFYTIKNNGNDRLRLWFGYEMNFLFSRKDANDSSDHQGISNWEREDIWYGFRTSFSFDSACDLWSFPIETVSSAEDGFEKTYQGTSVVPHWKIDLDPGASVDLPASIRIHERERVYA